MQRVQLEVYTSGYPNYFTYGIRCMVDTPHHTYSLIDNQHWVRSSTALSDVELEGMKFIDVNYFYVPEN